ncbi:MAG: hypothetical protein HRF42_02375 [Candidatus Brocadia sp.]|jgi:hypothetical protein
MTKGGLQFSELQEVVFRLVKKAKEYCDMGVAAANLHKFRNALQEKIQKEAREVEKGSLKNSEKQCDREIVCPHGSKIM